MELRVSIKLFIESEISYFNKPILKSPRNFSNKGETKSFVKSFIGNVGCLYMQTTLLHFDHIISIKVDSIFPGS